MLVLVCVSRVRVSGNRNEAGRSGYLWKETKPCGHLRRLSHRRRALRRNRSLQERKQGKEGEETHTHIHTHTCLLLLSSLRHPHPLFSSSF